ncbi:O-methyltransferase [Myxococcus stipitatus DSM 14675]|uniref:O-methyltransferase n=1 Tax=Myxococcus stipitatus (strain DSM 14675 / JCM 12634 / Mx s8) TaxID=1278073 RepID=L7UN21_MYXSD|nr:class I SAM-dependent methyltransferase [Myxococcus stipitatus]AGC47864.1 O-methyltransferase [Myxococcus stipitatus DSM 14675]
MTQLTLVSPEAEEYARTHSVAPAPLFEELKDITLARTSSPGMQVGPVEGAFLKMLVSLTRAGRVLEIGTFTGYSALMMAEGLPDDGELITCDLNPETSEIARAFFARSPHGRKIQLEFGPALETLKTLRGPFDLAFIDADKVNYGAYWDAVVPLVRAGGLVVVDNVLWSGRVMSPESEVDRAMAAFNEKVRKDARLEPVMLTVRDGMTLARKR